MDHQTQNFLGKSLNTLSRQIQILLYIHNSFMKQDLNGRAKANVKATTLY